MPENVAAENRDPARRHPTLRTHHLAKLVNPPGDAKPDAGQYVETARRMGFENLLPEDWDDHLERHPYEDYREAPLHAP